MMPRARRRTVPLAAALAASTALAAWSLPADAQSTRPVQYFPIDETPPPAEYRSDDVPLRHAAPSHVPTATVQPVRYGPEDGAEPPAMQAPRPSFNSAPAPGTAASPSEEPATDGPAPGSLDSERAVITADELTHDKGLDTVTARGGVEIHYAGRILLADTVNYQVTKDYATASGNVTLVEPDGTTMFADHVELEDKLKEGLVNEIRILLTDGSRAAAHSGIRSDGRTTMRQAVYSACDACEDDPGRPLAWQIKAMNVVHDQTEKEVIYHNAWLEMFGVPVAYTPYLSHADPTVKRRSGLLSPSYGASGDLGMSVTVPYYYTFSPSHDVTISSMFTGNEGPVLIGEHRLAFDRGRIVTDGSITQNSDGDIRNHLFTEGVLHLDDTWRAGANVNLTSDDTYLRIYDFDNASYLTSRAYLEGFSRRSYAVLEGYAFQNLSRYYDEPGQSTPWVIPNAGWYYVGAPGQYGAWHTADVTSAIVARNDGPDSRRLSAEYGWHVPYTGPMGDVYRLDLTMRGDAYHVEDVTTDDSGHDVNGATGRLIPTAALTWSLPLERAHDSYHEVLEPIVMGVVSPRGQNRDRIPNEDSLDFEFDESNLFEANRFTGYDRIENGPRVSYGLRYSAYGSGFGRVSTIIGQSWRAWPDGAFRPNSGVDEQFSDYVGNVSLQPSDNFDLVYRFRLDKDTLETKRNNLALNIGPPVLNLDLDYLSLEGAPLEDGGARTTKSLSAEVRSKVSRYWTIGLNSRHDLTAGGGPVRAGGSVEYEDECLWVDLAATRDFTYDRDYEGDFRISLRVTLKTLGVIETQSGL